MRLARMYMLSMYRGRRQEIARLALAALFVGQLSQLRRARRDEMLQMRV